MTRPVAWFLSICGAIDMCMSIATDSPIWFGIGLASVVYGVRRLFYAEA